MDYNIQQLAIGWVILFSRIYLSKMLVEELALLLDASQLGWKDFQNLQHREINTTDVQKHNMIQTVIFKLPDGISAYFHVLLCFIVNGISFSICHTGVATGHQVTVYIHIHYRYTQSMVKQYTHPVVLM